MSLLLTLGPGLGPDMCTWGWNGMDSQPPEPPLTLQGTWAPSSAGFGPSLVTQPLTISGVPSELGRMCAQEGSRSHPGHHVL